MTRKNFSDVSSADRQRNELIPEEFPDGPVGSSIRKFDPVENKSTPWIEGQKRMSNFSFPDEEQHDDLPRQFEGAHEIHDEPGESQDKEKER